MIFIDTALVRNSPLTFSHYSFCPAAVAHQVVVNTVRSDCLDRKANLDHRVDLEEDFAVAPPPYARFQ